MFSESIILQHQQVPAAHTPETRGFHNTAAHTHTRYRHSGAQHSDQERIIPKLSLSAPDV